MDQLRKVIERAQRRFADIILALVPRLTTQAQIREIYVRCLSMQYHLTKGVQRPFFTAAAHPDMATRSALRSFLIRFAQEEEPHFRVAQKDLESLGSAVGPVPIDVELWWAYFDQVVASRPFLRLGASALLENIAALTSGMFDQLEQSSPFLNASNTAFFKAHQHGPDQPHGEELLEVLSKSDLTAAHWSDLAEGAEKGMTIYLRCLRGALEGTAAP